MAAERIGQSIADSESLWRYFSLIKFLHLVQTQQLYFARLDKLNDPFEGYPTTKEVRVAASTFLDPIIHLQSDLIRKCAYISCWSRFDSENPAMWTNYGTGEVGVLVQTTFGRLASVLPPSVCLGKVRYVSDSDSELEAPIREPGEMVLRKLDYFKHEREVRAITFDEDTPIDGQTNVRKLKPIDVKRLVQSIIVQPTIQEEFRSAIEPLLKQYGFSVQQSVLSRLPAYGGR